MSIAEFPCPSEYLTRDSVCIGSESTCVCLPLRADVHVSVCLCGRVVAPQGSCVRGAVCECLCASRPSRVCVCVRVYLSEPGFLCVSVSVSDRVFVRVCVAVRRGPVARGTA